MILLVASGASHSYGREGGAASVVFVVWWSTQLLDNRVRMKLQSCEVVRNGVVS